MDWRKEENAKHIFLLSLLVFFTMCINDLRLQFYSGNCVCKHCIKIYNKLWRKKNRGLCLRHSWFFIFFVESYVYLFIVRCIFRSCWVCIKFFFVILLLNKTEIQAALDETFTQKSVRTHFANCKVYCFVFWFCCCRFFFFFITIILAFSSSCFKLFTIIK